MRLLKLLQIYEVDGFTPKHRSERFDFDQIQGQTFCEMNPTEVGSPMMLSAINRYIPFKTTRVQAIDRDGMDFRVLTRNTIYHFEVHMDRKAN
ncbi:MULTISPECIES: hypothetical protein [Paenibacillus]|uniref:Uncharacterized protein n=2 Tax=Paenibacillus TaxID=44249 RepID=A0A1V4HAQ1_9BACL|nr:MULTISPECIES: hypothetical protein [Paenibacillus]MEC0231838.1 hypothetical protein [Paenibacillus alba]NQX71022.1 hypothetical protein [Paenibacillus alba]OPH48291.1 hypothetical protein BC351_38510 [Paenibacillus ferrarius]